MDQAVKMKTADQAIFRSKFDKWPRFYQNSVFAGDVVKEARGMAFGPMLSEAEKLKALGNGALGEGDFMKANHCYEQALSVFKYAENVDPDWKSKGMRDDSLVERSYLCASSSEESAVRGFMKSVYLNLALVCQKTGEWDIAIQACDECLEIEDDNAKALYRRAMSRVAPKSSGGVEQEMAMEDLIRASDSNPGDKTIAKELRAMRQKVKEQRKKDKLTFTGMFERGEVYTKDEELLVRDRLEKAERSAARAKVMGTGEEDNLDRRIYEADALYNVYMKQGRLKEAEELGKKVEEAKEGRRKIREGRGGGIDFDNPTAKMVEDAKERGIDLNDPQVKDMLKRLKEEKEGKPVGEEPSYDGETRGKLMEMVKDMEGRELRECLKEMGLDAAEGKKEEEYREMFVKALMDGKKIPSNWRPTPRISPFTQKVLSFLGAGSKSWWGNLRVSLIVLFFMVAYRVITVGMARGGPRVRVPYVEEVVRDGEGVSRGWEESEEF
ncbi:hypothetical protein TrRE_jg4931 [Triparma retinervis]|uniref:peptidylprolyl isomerase n=1 Tax=Triparma retinervis TaxID=2557542 RepID=A0A9W7CCB1_9STRA|nr:hypothetical protein TrRE_jg4931 [Triparma retinervis]